MPSAPGSPGLVVCLAAALVTAPALAAGGSIYDNGDAHRAAKVGCEIEVDGALDEPCWADAAKIDTWFETNPGDNVPPPVANSARLAYDGEFLYAAFEFEEPDPSTVRSPLGDRDNVPSTTDYGGVILDPKGDGQVAQMFLANARGIQYDAISSDSSGEDSTPDFYWESAGRVTARGWQLEMRIPFSSIRYVDPDPQSWGVLLYRNRPRQFRNQYFSSRLPRDRNCFICNVRPLEGLAGLPTGDHWVAAPYVSASGAESAAGGPGGELESESEEIDGGADLKWLPNPDTVLDATINPDFSQIESDTAQITANERFAIFQPERRTFFLESVDLLSSPVDAVYTRTFTSPKWGARATGGGEASKYTFLVGQDRGGGSTILPGTTESSLAEQDFESWVAIGRFRRDLGPSSFVSLLYTGREIDGGAYNRVLGPDFRWQWNESNTLTGQLLFSASETPNRPDLAEEWDGRELSGHAGELYWYRSDGKWDHDLVYEDYSNGFRADNGFVPQVGYRELYGDFGRTWRPTDGAFRRVRLFTQVDRQEDREGALLREWIGPGIGFDAKWNSYGRIEVNFDEVLGVEKTHERTYLVPYLEVKPGKVLALVAVEARIGDQVDFAHDRLGDGLDVSLEADVRPTDHLRLVPSYSRRTLDVETDDGRSGRLFTAEVGRLLATYTFNARSWLRAIGQWVGTERDPSLWEEPVDAESGEFGGSLVFAYKLNWQTVLYLGYSDLQGYDEQDRLEPAERQAFFKVSYAFRG
jgi:hypothetical protein